MLSRLFKGLWASNGTAHQHGEEREAHPANQEVEQKQVLIVSDHTGITAQIQTTLAHQGSPCPDQNMVATDQAIRSLIEIKPEIIILVLLPNPELAIQVLGSLRELTQCRIVVVGPGTDPKLILRTMRSGADEYVDEGEVEYELKIATMMKKNDLRGSPATGKVIATLGPSGGSGSSTLATSIAAILARECHRALLIDMKLELGDLAALLDVKPSFTLGDMCLNSEHLDRNMFDRCLVQHSSGIHLLSAPQKIVDRHWVTPERMIHIWNWGRTLFPYVVVDVDHTFREEQMEVLHQADSIVLIVRLEFAALKNVQRTLTYLGQEGIMTNRIHLVVNRYGQRKEVPAASAEDALGVKIQDYIPEDAGTVNRANNNGVPVVLESPSSRIARSLEKLALNLRECLAQR